MLRHGRGDAGTREAASREALELALYTFKYVDGVDSVIVFMPVNLGDPATEQDDTSTALFLARHRRRASRPLQLTLAGQAGTVIDPAEGLMVDSLTRPRHYLYDIQPTQDLGAVLRLVPFADGRGRAGGGGSGGGSGTAGRRAAAAARRAARPAARAASAAAAAAGLGRRRGHGRRHGVALGSGSDGAFGVGRRRRLRLTALRLRHRCDSRISIAVKSRAGPHRPSPRAVGGRRLPASTGRLQPARRHIDPDATEVTSAAPPSRRASRGGYSEAAAARGASAATPPITTVGADDRGHDDAGRARRRRRRAHLPEVRERKERCKPTATARSKRRPTDSRARASSFRTTAGSVPRRSAISYGVEAADLAERERRPLDRRQLRQRLREARLGGQRQVFVRNLRAEEPVKPPRSGHCLDSFGLTLHMQRKTLVSGAGSGIGRAIAERLERDGHSVLAVDLRPGRTGPGEPFEADLSTREGNRAAVAAAIERFGGLDTVVASAGFQHVAPIAEFPEERWDALLAVLLTSPFLLARYAWEALERVGDGRFLAIASVHGLVGSPFKAGYVAAKHGLLGLVKVLALEGAERGISVAALCPGYVRTPIVTAQIEASRARPACRPTACSRTCCSRRRP